MRKSAWLFDVPLVALEFSRLLAGPGLLVACHLERARLPAVSNSSAQCHLCRKSVEVLRLALD